MEVSYEEIVRARSRIQKYAVETPIRRWEYLRQILGFEAPVYLKLETLQNTGAFKVRGAANKIVSLIEDGRRPGRVVAASAGNHAQAVAYVCGKLGIPATIVMPEGAPLVKAAATRDYGAEVILHGSMYDEAYAEAQLVLQQQPDAVYVHAYEDPAIICGQGTLGIEIHEQMLADGVGDDDIQVVVPIGGGGLMSGAATALKHLRPRARMLGVVTQAAPAMAKSFEAGHVIDVPSNYKRVRTLGDGLAVKKVSELTFGLLKRLVDEISIVNDDDMALAIARLMERGKVVVEGSGAAGVAAAIAGKFKHLDPKKPLMFVLCGGNIDMNMMSTILKRGLSQDGRWLSLRLIVDDRPGELARISTHIAGLRANVIEVTHDRISARCPVGYTAIRFQLETRGEAHADEVIGSLRNEGFEVEVLSVEAT